jgi:hypothetical protein
MDRISGETDKIDGDKDEAQGRQIKSTNIIISMGGCGDDRMQGGSGRFFAGRLRGYF